MEDINLLKNELQSDSEYQSLTVFRRVKRLLGVVILILALAGGTFYSLGYWFATTQKDVELALEEKRLELSKTAQTERDRLVTAQAQLANSQTILASHPYWYAFSKTFLATMPAEVEVESFSGSSEGRLTVQGSAPDLSTIADVSNRLQSLPDVLEVQVTNSSLQEIPGATAYHFSLVVDFLPEALIFTYAQQSQPE